MMKYSTSTSPDIQQNRLREAIPVWVSDLGDSSYYVAIFNLNAFPTRVRVNWRDLGFLGAFGMRDLWNHAEIKPPYESFSHVLPGHGARLFTVTPFGHPPTPPSHLHAP